MSATARHSGSGSAPSRVWPSPVADALDFRRRVRDMIAKSNLSSLSTSISGSGKKGLLCAGGVLSARAGRARRGAKVGACGHAAPTETYISPVASSSTSEKKLRVAAWPGKSKGSQRPPARSALLAHLCAPLPSFAPCSVPRRLRTDPARMVVLRRRTLLGTSPVDGGVVAAVGELGPSRNDALPRRHTCSMRSGM